jgi:hypothetical protein
MNKAISDDSFEKCMLASRDDTLAKVRDLIAVKGEKLFLRFLMEVMADADRSPETDPKQLISMLAWIGAIEALYG